ncbi:hypothetical protein [Lentilactobacillus sunkii]|uniref:AbrB family transcriptional regulator n=1 Tax=Lentilactobacillus sunkii TaxID=481719 RepID=A0A1E7XGK4_9LACO|nr:hypothetical protein [Lentilactobacillus sunkii]OFA12221.1 hypothetical protein LASUN_07730 [Lentilactobacillus sunkii]
MRKVVTLRKSGNSLVLTVPVDLDASLGTKYDVETRSDGSILYTPIGHKNIFDDPDWQHYDYQHDLESDPQLQPLDLIGKEGVE